MSHRILGLHHVTATVDDAQADLDFCIDLLGMRLVKKTVNFDNHDVYHFYYGTERGAPGHDLDDVPVQGPRRARRREGRGPGGHDVVFGAGWSLEFWRKPLAATRRGVTATSRRASAKRRSASTIRRGLRFELVATDATIATPWTGNGVGRELTRFAACTASTMMVRDRWADARVHDRRARLQRGRTRPRAARASPSAATRPGHVIDVDRGSTMPARLNGLGTVHHVAMAMARRRAAAAARRAARASACSVTEVRDRCYFTSIYFREPGGVLFEVATMKPGFTVDEDASTLGRGLKLPPWEEQYRDGDRAEPGAGETVRGELTAGRSLDAFTAGSSWARRNPGHPRSRAASRSPAVSRMSRRRPPNRTWYPHSFMAEIARTNRICRPRCRQAGAGRRATSKRPDMSRDRRSSCSVSRRARASRRSSRFGTPSRFGGLDCVQRRRHRSARYTGGSHSPGSGGQAGRFDGTPVFFGCSDVDAHVPEARVIESAELFPAWALTSRRRIYPGMGHLVNDDEIAWAQGLLDRLLEKP